MREYLSVILHSVNQSMNHHKNHSLELIIPKLLRISRKEFSTLRSSEGDDGIMLRSSELNYKWTTKQQMELLNSINTKLGVPRITNIIMSLLMAKHLYSNDGIQTIIMFSTQLKELMINEMMVDHNHNNTILYEIITNLQYLDGLLTYTGESLINLLKFWSSQDLEESMLSITIIINDISASIELRK